MVTVRKATKDDCHFIAEIILLAESTGNEITSYTKMFGMSDEELMVTMEKMIANEIEGHPLTYRTYLIATIDNQPVAAISAYKESEAGDSNHLMTGVLMTGFDRKKVSAAFGFLKQNAYLSIPKGRGTMQIDCVATLPEHRRKGLLKLLIAEAEKEAAAKGVNEVQIQVWKKNTTAVKAYEKLGYQVVAEQLSNEDIENGKQLMTKKI